VPESQEIIKARLELANQIIDRADRKMSAIKVANSIPPVWAILVMSAELRHVVFNYFTRNWRSYPDE